MTAFTVEDCFYIKGRGPCITRSEPPARAAFASGDLFAVGDVIECDGLAATVTGIERWAVPGPQSQQSLLLRGVELAQIARGQTWTKVVPLCDGEHAERPAVFRLVMLDTTSLDSVFDLCSECAIAVVGDWLANPEDVTGYEVRKL